MKRLIHLAICLSALGLIQAEEITPLDLKNPTATEPGKKYSFVIQPRKDKDAVTLVLATAADSPEVEKIIQPGADPIAVETDMTTIGLEIDDYDGDSYLDFRLVTNSGSGGTWYSYYRYDGKQYVEWEEPGRLAINSFDKEKKIAVAFSKSGPAHLSTSYTLVGRHFVKIGREIYDQAKNLREHVGKEIGDNEYVRINETVEDGKVTKRTVTKDNPWESESR